MVLFVVANTFPIVGLSVNGTLVETTLFGAAQVLYDDGVWPLPLGYEPENDPQAELAERIADKIADWQTRKETLPGGRFHAGAATVRIVVSQVELAGEEVSSRKASPVHAGKGSRAGRIVGITPRAASH